MCGALPCDHFVPVFPLIPAYSRSESRNYLDFLRVRSGFEPEGRGFESLPACHSSTACACPKRRVSDCAGVDSTQWAKRTRRIPPGVPSGSTTGSHGPARDLEPHESAKIPHVSRYGYEVACSPAIRPLGPGFERLGTGRSGTAAVCSSNLRQQRRRGDRRPGGGPSPRRGPCRHPRRPGKSDPR